MAITKLEVLDGDCPVLHETGCRYLHLFNSVPVSIAVIEPCTSRYLEVNQIFCDRLKYTREEILAASVADINPRFQPAALAELARKLQSTNVVQVYGCQTTRDGEELEVLMTVAPIYRDGAMLLHCATVDFTAQLRAEREAVASERRFRETFEQAAVGIAHVAADGSLLRVNHRFCDIVDYTEAELRLLKFDDITHPDDLAADWTQAKALLRGDIETYSMEKRYIRKGNGAVWINLTCSVARNQAGEPEYFIAVVEDISARKRAEAERDELIRTLEEQVRRRTEELERISMTDALTGIANRRRLDAVLATEWGRSIRSRQPLSLIVIDVDHFKALNDHLGHAYADRCMVTIADNLRRLSTRSSDVVARYGGDEFIILLPETDQCGAQRLAQEAQQAIQELSLVNPGAPNIGIITISQGTATIVPSMTTSPQDLLEEADRAMYAAKRRGRNQIFAGAADQG